MLRDRDFSDLMQEIFARFISDLECSRDIDSLRGALAEAGKRIGIDALAYIGFDEPGQESPVYISNYPDRWTERYVERGYDRIDPVINRASRDFLPFYWTCPDDVGGFSRECRQLFDEAQEHGIGCGFTIPIHDTGGRTASFNLASNGSLSEFREIIEAGRQTLHLMGIYFHAHAREKANTRRSDPRLSFREIECLGWSAQGKSHADIGVILGISRRTVKFHIENTMRKFNVSTTRQAVAYAMMYGYISVK